MIRFFQNPLKNDRLNATVDDPGDMFQPFIWVVIGLAFLFIIIPAVVSIILK